MYFPGNNEKKVYRDLSQVLFSATGMIKQKSIKQIRDLLQQDGLLFKTTDDIKKVKMNGLCFHQKYSESGLFKFVSLNIALFIFEHKNGKEYTIEVPEGFEWDGGSVPSELRGLIQVQPLITPSLPHDYLYSEEGQIKSGKENVEYNRHDADIIFGYLILMLTKSDSLRVTCQYAVQTFGGSHYKKK